MTRGDMASQADVEQSVMAEGYARAVAEAEKLAARVARLEAAASSPELREKLADYAHSAWAGWMVYLFSKGTFNEDGTWTMPSWAVERWKRQMLAVYDDLPENEKPSDRAEADRMLDIVRAALEREE